MTLGSVLASLSETNALTYSFNNGTLTLTQTDSNVYIVSDSSNLFEKLNIDIEDFYAETTSTTPAVSTVGDSNRLQVNVEVEDTVYRPETISVNTTIEALELDSENGTIT